MDAVTVYLLNARALAGREETCLPLLTPKRRQAAEAHKHESARLRTIAAGLLLRDVLGVRDDADLIYNEFGKPALAAGRPCFNLSDGGDWAALAVAGFPVGVDLEPLRENWPAGLRRCFLPDELAWLDEEPAGERFWVLWTRLEAVLKARGTGFALRERTVPLLEDGRPWYFKNAVHAGCMLACAAPAPFELRLTERRF